MKKLFTVVALLFIGTIGSTATYHHYGHSVKCAKCVEEFKKWPGIISILLGVLLNLIEKKVIKYMLNITVLVVIITGLKLTKK